MDNTKIGKIKASVLNIRKGPSTTYEVITKGYKGETVKIIETSNKWHKVMLESKKIGWASLDYIDILDDKKDDNLSNNKGNINANISEIVENIIKLAKEQLGKPYEWAAEGPSSFDCSGLVYYVYMRNGIDLPRVSRNQYTVGKAIKLENIQRGDLLFFSTNGTGNVSHVGIYIGDGNMIHSPTRGKVVSTVSINISYWKGVYIGAKRVV